MALGGHAISIYKQQKHKCTRKTTVNYITWIVDNTERNVCYVGKKRAEKITSMGVGS